MLFEQVPAVACDVDEDDDLSGSTSGTKDFAQGPAHDLRISVEQGLRACDGIVGQAHAGPQRPKLRQFSVPPTTSALEVHCGPVDFPT